MTQSTPRILSARIEGDLSLRGHLTLRTEYAGDVPEGHSRIEWLISPPGQPEGAYRPLEGIRTRDIPLIAYYKDRYCKARITPVDADGREGQPYETHAAGPVSQRGNPKLAWFRDAKYGIMHHFLHDYINVAAADEHERLPGKDASNWSAPGWDAYLDSFDVDAYVRDVKATGARFVILTIGQHDGFCNAHNPVYDAYAGVAEGERTPAAAKRDLPMELAIALKREGIRLLFYSVSCPPLRAHVRYDADFDPATKPMAGDFAITERFGMMEHKDAPPTQRTLGMWQDVLRYWSEHYGEHLAGWWLDGMWTSQNSLRDGTYEVLPDLTPNPDADPDAAYAPAKAYNWHTFADALRAGNPDRLISLSLGCSDEINVPHEDFVGGEADRAHNFRAQVPFDPAKSQVDGWASEEMGIQWFFMCSMGVPVAIYDYWGQKGAGADTDAVVAWFRETTGRGAVVVSDSKVNRFGRIDPAQMAQWRLVREAVYGA